MAHDTYDLDIPPPPPAPPALEPAPSPSWPAARRPSPRPPPRPDGRRRPVVLAGIAGACVMGAGLGLWARPADSERLRGASRPQPAAERMRRLHVVVVGRPEPAQPFAAGMRPPETAPASLLRITAPLGAPANPMTADLPAPSASPAPGFGPAAPAPSRRADPKPLAEAARPVGSKTPEARTPKGSKVAAQANNDPEGPRTAEARKSKAEVKKAEVKKAEVKKPEVKKATTPKSSDTAKKAAKIETTDKAARTGKAVEVAKAAATTRKHSTAPAETPTVKAKPPAPAPPAATARPAAVEGGGPLRKASHPCAGLEAAEALVCADPSLGAADRQLTRAYQRAEAAGVSGAELRRQQQRWLAARAAAAREAPWAVQDVYQARIAELEDLTREAGY
jgi:hypothetical protein